MKIFLVEYETDRNERYVGYVGGQNEAIVRRMLAGITIVSMVELPPRVWEENIDERPDLELNY